MLNRYTNLFVASSGAAAAFIGLLFVALTIANQEERDSPVRTRRDALAASCFALLIDAFFVSVGGLLDSVRTFASVGVVMAGFGLLTTGRHLPRAVRSGSWSRDGGIRVLAVVLPAFSVLLYLVQAAFGVGVLASPSNSDLLRLSVLVTLGLYAGALARAWEITKT